MRGIVPSLGAGGSLIAAALCVAALVGGLIAFRGKSPGTPEANSGDVVVPTARTARARPSAPVGRTVATHRPARAATAPRPAHRLQTRRVVTRTTVSSPRVRTVTPRVGAVTPRVTTPPAAPSRPSPALPIPDPSGTVQRVVEQVRAVADPVVDTAGDTVQSAAETVDQTVAGL